VKAILGLKSFSVKKTLLRVVVCYSEISHKLINSGAILREMRCEALQDNLRRAVQERIAAGELTGVRLSELTGFRQAHISNFLNGKRGLSLDGMDKMLRVLKLGLLDLVDGEEIKTQWRRVSSPQSGFRNILLVASAEAWQPRIGTRQVQDVFPFRESFLSRLRPAMEGDRRGWERFVLVRMERNAGSSMSPKTTRTKTATGAVVLIDRHYNSLRPYRKHEPNLYAVHHNGQCAVRYVEQIGGQLLFRPLNADYPIAVVKTKKTRAKDFVIGRVCYVASEV
jgi:hypothetical protein